MTSLIEQLQAEALDPQGRASDLVRKAKLVASKLGLDEFEKWADAELQGYTDTSTVPDYRHLHGTPMWLNPVRGWLPINFTGDGVRWAKRMSENTTYQPIGELDALVGQSAGGRGGSFHIPFGAELTEAICKSVRVSTTQVSLNVDSAELAGILDAVRNAVLDWTVRLEKAGIRGDGLSFSEKEKATAHQPSVVYQINSIQNFAGNLGPASGHASVAATQSVSDVAFSSEQLAAYIREQSPALGLAPAESGEMLSRVAELEAAGKDQGKLARALKSIRALAGKATNKVIEVGITAVIDKYLGPGAGPS